MNSVQEIFGVKIHTGENTHPGSGPAENHLAEHEVFKSALSFLINQRNPIMIELGSFWALWSLCFRHRFPDGHNILVDLGKNQLKTGVDNFKLNNFTETHYWGGFFKKSSGTFHRKEKDVDYENPKNTKIGPELNFVNLWQEQNLECVDLLHLDIEGSELPLLKQLDEAGSPCVFEGKKYWMNMFHSIHTLIIATHSPDIHEKVLFILKDNGYQVPFNKLHSDEEDGHIVATR